MRSLAALAFLLVPTLAQELKPRPQVPMRPESEYLRPPRAPDKNLQPPLDLYDELRTMRAIARDANAKVSIDTDGREVCDSAAWRDARAKAQIKAVRMGGYLAVVGKDSGDANDRGLAYYGAYWLDSVQDTMAIMALIPGEPLPQLREEAMQHALAFLRVHLAKTHGGDGGARAPSAVDYADGRAVGNRVYDDPDTPAYDFDVNPWCALVECEQARDKAQGLWFLRELTLIRKGYGAETLALLKPLMPALLIHKEIELRRQARAYVAAADPKVRPTPKDDAPDEVVVAWFESILYELFPPIRQVSAGLFELYPSADRDLIVATGKDLLERDAIGSPASGTLHGVYYRGFKLQRVPKPLDMLKIPADAVITSINGVPLSDSKSVLDTLTSTLGKRRSVMIEFVVGEKAKAIEYRLK